jgi:hypothetical protein
MLHNAEAAGKRVTPGTVAYYAIKLTRAGRRSTGSGATVAIGPDQNQCFLFEYQCQKCKEEFVRFLIRRDGLKIQLTGRDPIALAILA